MWKMDKVEVGEVRKLRDANKNLCGGAWVQARKRRKSQIRLKVWQTREGRSHRDGRRERAGAWEWWTGQKEPQEQPLSSEVRQQVTMAVGMEVEQSPAKGGPRYYEAHKDLWLNQGQEANIRWLSNSLTWNKCARRHGSCHSARFPQQACTCCQNSGGSKYPHSVQGCCASLS